MRLFISIAALEALAFALVTVLLSANAAAQTLEFSGAIDSVTDPSGYLDPSIQAGSSFLGSYVVDLSALDAVGVDTGFGTLYSAVAPGAGGVEATVEGEAFSHPIEGILVADDRDLSQIVPYFGIADGWVPALTFEEGSIGVVLRFWDEAATKLVSEGRFVNDTLAGWSHAELWIVREGTASDPQGIVLARGTISGLGPPSSGLSSFNIDLGYVNGAPSSSYGAAGPTGTWNLINGFASTSLVDTDGNPSGVSATLATFSDGGSVPGPATDAHALLGDHALDCVGALLEWELTVDGLSDGDYRVWLYAPMDATVETGDVEVNGVMVASIPGDTSGALIEGTSYARVDISVSGGSFGFYALGTGAAACAGVAGIQIEGPLATPVPALATAPRALLAALLAACAGILYGRRHGRREANAATR